MMDPKHWTGHKYMSALTQKKIRFADQVYVQHEDKFKYNVMVQISLT